MFLSFPCPRVHRRPAPALAGLLPAALAVVLAAPAGAAIFRTTTTADVVTGECARVCSLRDAILAANASPGDDVVLLRAGDYLLTRAGRGEDAGATGDLDVADALYLVGAGAAKTRLDASGLDRVLHLHPGVALVAEDLTLRGGSESGLGGGALLAESDAELALRRVVVEDNSSTGAGGGVLSRAATFTLEASTLARNRAQGDGGGIALLQPRGQEAAFLNVTLSGNDSRQRGGGIYAGADSGASLRHVTVVGNSAALEGGGVHSESVPFMTLDRLELGGSIVADNSAAKNRDCSGAPVSRGENVVAVAGACIDLKAAKGDVVGTAAQPLAARLGTLGGNGGPTPTHALFANSPAVDLATDCPAVDQRGVERSPARCDAGAFELAADVCVAGAETLCLLDGRFRVTVRWTAPDGRTGAAIANAIGDASGTFSFFGPDDVEVALRMIDGCAARGTYWVFVSGLTNLAVTVRVEDVLTGQVKEYRNPQGRRFAPRFDTRAFATCGG